MAIPRQSGALSNDCLQMFGASFGLLNGAAFDGKDNVLRTLSGNGNEPLARRIRSPFRRPDRVPIQRVCRDDGLLPDSFRF